MQNQIRPFWNVWWHGCEPIEDTMNGYQNDFGVLLETIGFIPNSFNLLYPCPLFSNDVITAVAAGTSFMNIIHTQYINKKPRGFMQSCFAFFVYFKCCSDFLLYFYKCSTSMAFT